MALIEIILKPIAQKMAGNMLDKREAQNEAIARGEYTPPPKVNPFKDFWSLDNKKTRGQAIVTLLFFMAIVSAMDAIVFLPFVGNEDVAEVLDIVERFPPSYFVGFALTVLVMMGREIPAWMKVVMAVVSAGGGYMLGSFVALLPVAYLLQKPLIGEGGASVLEEEIEEKVTPPVVTKDVIETSLDTQLQEPQDIQKEPELKTELEKKSEAAPSKPDVAEKNEESDDFVDPIDDFLKGG